MKYFCHDRVGKGFKHCHRRYVPNISAVITINFSLDGVNIPFMEGLTLESVRFPRFCLQRYIFRCLKIERTKTLGTLPDEMKEIATFYQVVQKVENCSWLKTKQTLILGKLIKQNNWFNGHLKRNRCNSNACVWSSQHGNKMYLFQFFIINLKTKHLITAHPAMPIGSTYKFETVNLAFPL